MVTKYPDFWKVIIGNAPLGSLLGYIVVAYICAGVSILIEASNRNITSANTPIKFSWQFLIAANIPRILANFMLIPIFIRLIFEYISNPTWMLFVAIGIGAGVDRLAMLFKNIGVLTSDKIAKGVADKLTPSDPTITPKS